MSHLLFHPNQIKYHFQGERLPLKSFFLGNQGGIFGAGSGSGNIFDNYSWHFVIFVVLFLPLKQSKTLKSVESLPLKNEKLPESVESHPLKNEKLPEPVESLPLKTEENPFSGGHDTQKTEPRCHFVNKCTAWLFTFCSFKGTAMQTSLSLILLYLQYPFFPHPAKAQKRHTPRRQGHISHGHPGFSTL